MSLSDLNSSVTEAIVRAEGLPSGSWEARSAFREVSELEEAIAATMSAKDVEGEIARVGAVQAALSAGEPLRAAQLADRYSADDLSDGARTRIDELRAQADAEIRHAISDEPSVQPVRFRLRTAA